MRRLHRNRMSKHKRVIVRHSKLATVQLAPPQIGTSVAQGSPEAQHVKSTKTVSTRRKSERGTTLIETALGTFVFMMFIVGVYDFSRVQFLRSNLKYAVSQSTRFATIGGSLENPAAPGTQLSRDESIRHYIRVQSGMSVPDNDIVVNHINQDGTLLPGAGGPGDVVTVSATFPVPVIAPYIHAVIPSGEILLSATTSFRNENFPENNTAAAMNHKKGMEVK